MRPGFISYLNIFSYGTYNLSLGEFVFETEPNER
jgi:hypothetical protein